MLAFTLPDWLDPEMLQWVILVVIGVVLYLMYVVFRFVRRLAMKVALFVLLAGFGLSLWIQRDDLQDCARTCECSLYGQTVVIPYDQLPEDVRIRLEDGGATCRRASDDA